MSSPPAGDGSKVFAERIERPAVFDSLLQNPVEHAESRRLDDRPRWESLRKNRGQLAAYILHWQIGLPRFPRLSHEDIRIPDHPLPPVSQATTEKPEGLRSILRTHPRFAGFTAVAFLWKLLFNDGRIISDLLMRIGLGYRNLANRAVTSAQANALYENALFYFDRAANINKQLGVKDPTPYIAIAKTYTQQGQFFVAARNAETALAYSPSSADTYGQLGMIYVQARNYESALPALRCAVEGCTAEENITALEFMDQGLLEQSYTVAPLELTNLNVAYYYIRYGSVLAYLSDPENQYCAKSLQLMNHLRTVYGEDTVLMDNVAEVEGTCALLTTTP